MGEPNWQILSLYVAAGNLLTADYTSPECIHCAFVGGHNQKSALTTNPLENRSPERMLPAAG